LAIGAARWPLSLADHWPGAGDRTRFWPGRRYGQQAKPGPDRDEFVVVSQASGAGCQVAGNAIACAVVEGADDIGTDFATPLRA
jgi:hypothetical protein